MEAKSVSDCLDIIDIATVGDIDLWISENFRKNLLENGETVFNNEWDVLLCVFKQKNFMIGNLFELFGEDQKMRYTELRYTELRKLVLKWIIEYNIKLDADNGL